jgi:subtilisin
MSPKKDDQESRATTQSGREVLVEPDNAAGFAGRSTPRERASTRKAGKNSKNNGGAIASRPPQFMLFSRGLPGFQPLAGPELLEQSLRNNPDVDVVEVLSPRSTLDVFGATLGPQTVLVAQIDEHKASMFAGQAGSPIAIERDHALSLGPSLGPSLLIEPGNLHQALGFTANFKVTADGAPVEGAEVSVFGSATLTQGVTDRQGELQLDVTGESPATIRALYVNPRADCWTVWIPEPAITPSTEGENVIALTPLSATFPDFPRQQLAGWGPKAMRVDQLPPTYRGKGIKIGVIDSGVAATHTALRGQIKSGYDAANRSQQGWDQDAIGQGTHCAGIMCGRSTNGSGIQGIASEAEMVVCKVFPAGSYGSLFDAIDFCIAQQVDLIYLGVTGPEPSQIVEQKILQAKHLGIACIAAAGDSGGPVQYPASSPNVFAVAALGKQREFPEQSYHSQTVTAFMAPSGLFSPHFSCFGPQIAVAAPGVAVVSSVPPDNFAPRDGTGVAAAHVTGLAALMLAHHPDFQPQAPFGVRNGYRVDRLFQLIRQGSQNINLGNPFRIGAGLPDAVWIAAALPERPAFTAPFSHIPFSFPAEAALGPSPFIAALRPNGSPGTAVWPILPQGQFAHDQGNVANFLMAIQQIRAMMQSAGLML